MNPNNFDPTQYGATPITGGTTGGSSFDPTSYGAVPVDPHIQSPNSDQSATNLGMASNGVIQNILSGANRFIQPEIGFAKQVARTGIQTGADVEAGIDQTIGRGINALQGKGFTPTSTAAGPTELAKSPYLNPTNLMQQAGDIVANVAEFALPAGDVAKGEGLLNKAAEYLPSFLQGIGRVGGKAAIEAAQGGLTTLAQTGDPTQAMTAALTFGTLKSGTGALGETARAFKLPERLYETVFSKTAEDFASQWSGKAASAMEQSNPALYKQLLSEGIIKTDNGVISVDSSVAAQALKKGLSGSGDQMGTLLSGQMMQSESKAKSLAANFKGTVPITLPSNLVSVLRKTADSYRDVADNQITNMATKLADTVEQSSGQFKTNTAQISGEDALTLRRFLDRMRTESSFDKSLTDVRAVGQKNYKFLSDKVRTALNSSIPGMKDVMKDYSYQIRALDDLSSHMTKAGHAALMNVWDTMIFDVGLSGGVPGVGGALAVGRRYLGTAGGATRTAQAIEQGTQTGLGAAIKGGISNALNWMKPNSGNTPPQGQ